MKGDFFIILLSPPFSNTIISVIKAEEKIKKFKSWKFLSSKFSPNSLDIALFQTNKIVHIIEYNCSYMLFNIDDS